MRSAACGSSAQLPPKVASATRSSALMNSHMTKRLSLPPSGAGLLGLVAGGASGGGDGARSDSLSRAAAGASTSAAAAAAAAAAVAATMIATGVCAAAALAAAAAAAIAELIAESFGAVAAGRALRSSTLARAKMMSTWQVVVSTKH